MMGVGAFSIDYIARQTGRTHKAVYARITQDLGGGGVSRGTISLQQASARTGYTRRQIKRAGRALGQRWQRTSRYGRIMLSDDQLEALVVWLGHDYWCGRSRSYACAYCGRSDVPAKGLGLCKCCHDRHWYRFGQLGVRFARAGLLAAVAAVKSDLGAQDWLLAWEASLSEGCVLTRYTLDRLYSEAVRLGPDALRNSTLHSQEGSR